MSVISILADSLFEEISKCSDISEITDDFLSKHLGKMFFGGTVFKSFDLGEAFKGQDDLIRVCNVKVGCVRPKYDNLREWMSDPENVYIGRRGIVFVDGKRYPEKDSVWANPFKIGDKSTREEVLEKYRKYITERLETDQDLQKKLIGLKGKNLGCWCHPEKCHGDILLELSEDLQDFLGE